MSTRAYATIGRASDNDVCLEHQTVSSHHARLSWTGSSLLVEDLSSANGTFVDGRRIKSTRIRPGAELRLGQALLPWSHDGLRSLLQAGVGARTLVIPTQGAGSLRCRVCGACGRVAELPQGPTPKAFTCPHCGATLRTANRPRGQSTSRGLSWLLTAISLSAAGVLVHETWKRSGLPDHVPTSRGELAATLASVGAVGKIGAGTAEKIAAALTPSDAATRGAAVKLAAHTQGPYHIEQVAEIWNAVRTAWRYVNDPLGREYFAAASETIQNGYVGDCDDFAIALSSMVLAIGGTARVVVMNGPEGGHAYAEVCVPNPTDKLASELDAYYRKHWTKYLRGRTVPRQLAYRSSNDCPMWLNLDWNSSFPGGAYQVEEWAVAVYQDGHSELLAVAPAAGQATPRPAKSSALPLTKD